ncbi:hypothetical protein J437_LFUL009523 [Ladona fulva]|uniref:Uncharacterized protein n=1 Tax=Ladona fulva TaxID=123851 RepID=A0A8K0NZ09_LADFU|nr:hypothetical protein J437_LFUL009523 [Ladona fulva]
MADGACAAGEPPAKMGGRGGRRRGHGRTLPSSRTSCSSPYHNRPSSSAQQSGESRFDSLLCPGYEQYQKALLEVPWPPDYGEASSDDLSSEWDSDAPEAVPSPLPTPTASKVD